jgi:hypothetical protein
MCAVYDKKRRNKIKYLFSHDQVCVKLEIHSHKNTCYQCCGSGRFLTGSDFRKRPDPDPDLNKFSNNFLLQIFLAEICSKKCIHEPKS